MRVRPGDDPGRVDLAVVLARGRARRMGRPKGLLRLEPGDETFVARICRLYAGWAETVVVVGPGQAAAYAEAIGRQSAAQIIAGPPGQDTARTLDLGWRHAGRTASHVWAHPVDMPLVAEETVAALRAASAAHPGRIIRPVVGGRPGHPVVLPGAFLALVADDPAALRGPVRAVIPAVGEDHGGFTLQLLRCGDSGAVTDFDEPADLAGGPGKAETR